MILTTAAEFEALTEINQGIEFLSLTPSIDAAQSKFLKPILGFTFLNSIDNYYNDDPGAGANQIKNTIIALAQRALANLTLYLYVPIAEVEFTDSGLRRGHSDSSPGAFKYQVKELQRSYLERGFQYLEDLIEYMESKSAEPELEEWVASDEFKSYRSLFIRSGAELAKLYTSIRYPRRIFTLLQSTMYNVQELQIEKSISTEVYQLLKSKLLATPNNLSDQEEILLNYLKHALAHLTIAEGIIPLIATMDENGIHVLSNSTDSSSSESKQTAASDNILGLMIKNATSAGAEWLTKAVRYMNQVASETVFPTWYESMNTTVTPPTSINENLSGSFSM